MRFSRDSEAGMIREYNFEIEYDNNGLLRPTLPDAIQEFGLKLEDTKGMREILVIDSVEKPSQTSGPLWPQPGWALPTPEF